MSIDAKPKQPLPRQAAPTESLKADILAEHRAYVELHAEHVRLHGLLEQANRDQPSDVQGKELMCSEHPAKPWRHDDCNAAKRPLMAVWLDRKQVAVDAERLAGEAAEAAREALAARVVNLRVTYWYPGLLNGKPEATAGTIIGLHRNGRFNLSLVPGRVGSQVPRREVEYSEVPAASRWTWMQSGVV